MELSAQTPSKKAVPIGNKISADAAQAVREDRRFSRDNTSVRHGTLKLFGNTIAVRDGKDLLVGTAGYNTRTTKERLQAFVPLYTKHGKMYLYGKPWDGSMVRIPNYYTERENDDEQAEWK